MNSHIMVAKRNPVRTVPGRVLLVGALAVGALAAFPPSVALAGPIGTEITELAAPNNAPGAQFGSSVAAIGGNTIVVGSAGANVGAITQAGAAYVYTKSGAVLTEVASLVAPDGTTDAGFGYSVSISGSTLVVGAPNQASSPNVDQSSQGAVYIYTKSGTTWNLSTELNNYDPGLFQDFGVAVAIAGKTLVVGADAYNGSKGAAFVYTKTTTGWTQTSTLTAPDGAYSDEFGFSVSMNSTLLAIGAPVHSVAGNIYEGAVYVYVKKGTGWTPSTELVEPDATVQAEFGTAVSVFGTGAVAVGAPIFNNGAGEVYIYHKKSTSWVGVAALSPALSGVQELGEKVALGNDILLASSWGNNGYAGAAQIFVASNSHWLSKAVMVPPNSQPGDEFSDALTLTGTTAVIGAPGRNLTGTLFLYQA